MKKLIFTMGLFFSLAAVKAQNSVNVIIRNDACIDEFQIHYRSGGTESHTLGCNGRYAFDTGENAADAIIINGVTCYEGVTRVILPGGRVLRVESIQDEGKGFSSLIR